MISTRIIAVSTKNKRAIVYQMALHYCVSAIISYFLGLLVDVVSAESVGLDVAFVPSVTAGAGDAFSSAGSTASFSKSV